MVEQLEFHPDDARLSAYALGELEDADRADVEALLARNAEARTFVEELRCTAETLERGLRSEAKPMLTAQQRERVASAASGRSAAAPGTVRWRYLSAAGLAAASIAAALLVLRPWWSLESSAEVALVAQRQHRGQQPALPPTAEEVALEQQIRELGYLGYAGDAAPMTTTALAPSAASQAPAQSRSADPQALRFPGLALQPFLGAEEERTGSESYAKFAEHVFQLTRSEPLSTFSIDVDTASYSNVRRFLSDGQRPPADAVRIEELVNYFDYELAEPRDGRPFAVTTEVARCPWNPRHLLARIALKGREVLRNERQASNLVFLIDVSGSMSDARKLPLVVSSLRMLVAELDNRDRLAIVVYAGSSGLVLDSTSGRDRARIEAALERLQAGGSTNGGEGIALAYRVAREHFVEGGSNRVVLCTDGDFNVGVTDRGELVGLIERERASGVHLSVLGFGTGNLKDATMEQLADKGDGNYAYIDSLAEARKVLVEQIGGTLETIAKDVKIQLEFNPARVQAWRQLGYENRALAHRDFDDDAIDAGEIGAGHTVTALYELVPTGAELSGPGTEGLRYQDGADAPIPAEAREFSDELMFVKLRYKAPEGGESQLIAQPLRAGEPGQGSADLRFAAAVAAFGLKLRASPHTAEFSWSAIERLASGALGRDVRGYRVEFVDLVRRAAALR